MKDLLIADDSDEKIRFLEKCVQQHGPDALRTARILIARTTEEAAYLLSRHADLRAGFVDYQMPRKNGPWLIEHWRGIEKNRAYICLATGERKQRLFEQFAKEAREAGADRAIQIDVGDEEASIMAVRQALEEMGPYLLGGE